MQTNVGKQLYHIKHTSCNTLNQLLSLKSLEDKCVSILYVTVGDTILILLKIVNQKNENF